MTEPTKRGASQVFLIFSRAFCIYLLLYVLLISDFSGNYPVLWHINLAIKKGADHLGLLLFKLFFIVSKLIIAKGKEIRILYTF